MKGEKSEIWGKLPNALGERPKDMNANELLRGAGGITMPVGSGEAPGEPGVAEKPPKTIGHDAANPTMTDVENTGEREPRAGAGGGYKKPTGNTEAKTSEMAQRVGKPRKGF